MFRFSKKPSLGSHSVYACTVHKTHATQVILFNAFHTVVLRFNLLETVKHNKCIRSQITGCPLYIEYIYIYIYAFRHTLLYAICYML